MMDPQIASMSTPPYPDMPLPPQDDVDDFLKKKRKAREHKACYPCRQRKVKCDLNRPCQTCRDRDHTQLCTYEPPNKRQNIEQEGSALKIEDVSSNGGFVTLGRSEFDFLCRKLNTLENSIADLRHELRRNAHDRFSARENSVTFGAIDPAMGGGRESHSHTELHGVHLKNDAGDTVHFGAGSIPAMLYALQTNEGHVEQQQIQEMLGRNVLPLFGLDNESATYPFVDLWGLPHGSLARAQELAKALPSDAHMLEHLRCYTDMAYVVFPGIASPEQLEMDMKELLLTRATLAGTVEGVNEQQIYGKSFSWLALMFAVLASGVQCSVMPRKERELTSQVYVCCSFECLRFGNFLSQATLNSIQSLVVIGHVIMNNSNAGTAWSLLGLTLRLAHTHGIHRACPPDVPYERVFRRSKIWWAIVWQESLLGISYDRASAAVHLDTNTMLPPQYFGETGAYHATMYNVCKVGLEIVSERARLMSSREQIARITEHRDAMARIVSESAEYLRDSRKCNSTKETIEHWGLYLHSSYIMSELCRPAISPNADAELARLFRGSCIDNLVNTVEAFLGLNNITPFSRQSWASLHRGLGSALLLGITGEHTRDSRARKLIGRFINVLTDFTMSLDPQEISAPIQRGLSALSKLNIEDTRSSEGVNGMNHDLNDGTIVDEHGSLKLHRTSIMTPTNSESLGAEDEHSPYSVLNTILWGHTIGLSA